MAFMFLREALLTYQELHRVAGSGLEISQGDPGLHGMKWRRELHALSQSECDVAAGLIMPTCCLASAIEVDFTAKPEWLPAFVFGAVIGTTSETGNYASVEFKTVVSHPIPCNTVRLRAELAELEARLGRFALQSVVPHEEISK